MFTVMEQMKVRLEKPQITLDTILQIVEGLCSGAVSETTEDSESLREEMRFPLKTTEELETWRGYLIAKISFHLSYYVSCWIDSLLSVLDMMQLNIDGHVRYKIHISPDLLLSVSIWGKRSQEMYMIFFKALLMR